MVNSHILDEGCCAAKESRTSARPPSTAASDSVGAASPSPTAMYRSETVAARLIDRAWGLYRETIPGNPAGKVVRNELKT
jgi:hypothetical protein